MDSSKKNPESVEAEVHRKQPTEERSFELGELNKVDLDDVVLHANGHRAEMPRQFNWFSALGLSFSITDSWMGYMVSASSMGSCWLSNHSLKLTQNLTNIIRATSDKIYYMVAHKW